MLLLWRLWSPYPWMIKALINHDIKHHLCTRFLFPFFYVSNSWPVDQACTGFGDPRELWDPTGKPVENLYPHSRVWVSVGMGVGRPKTTCGSPVPITIALWCLAHQGRPLPPAGSQPSLPYFPHHHPDSPSLKKGYGSRKKTLLIPPLSPQSHNFWTRANRPPKLCEEWQIGLQRIKLMMTWRKGNQGPTLPMPLTPSVSIPLWLWDCSLPSNVSIRITALQQLRGYDQLSRIILRVESQSLLPCLKFDPLGHRVHGCQGDFWRYNSHAESWEGNPVFQIDFRTSVGKVLFCSFHHWLLSN
jgi:hypothetical protein